MAGKEGTGKFVAENGDTYEGGYVNDEKQGTGTFTWGKGPWEGHVYRGAWKNGMMDGQGEYITPKPHGAVTPGATCA